MSTTESAQSAEDLENIIQAAARRGYITSDLLSSLKFGKDEHFQTQSDLVDYFHDLGVVVLETAKTGKGKSRSRENTEDASPLIMEDVSVDDSVSMYMREMAVVPLLSLDEEVDLAKKIESASIAMKEISRSNGRLDACRRKELEYCIQEGFKSRESLIKANTRLVVSIARRYIGRGVPFLDLIQEGNMGLIRAVEKYEYARGFRFSTYATWWIRQSVTRAVTNQSRTIRVPAHMYDRLRNLYAVSRDFEQLHGRQPTASELSELMGIETSKVRWMQEVAQTPVSLDSPVGDEEDSELGSWVKDENALSPAQFTYQKMLGERLDEVLSTLTPREARILRLRFGLGQERPYTLEEVGQKFGLTRERIRQIEGKALRQLRHPKQAERLRDYI